MINRTFKRTALILNIIFYNNGNVFTVTSDQFNSSLLIKSITVFHKNEGGGLLTPKPLNCSLYIEYAKLPLYNNSMKFFRCTDYMWA